MDTPEFDPDDFRWQQFRYWASENGSFVESLTLREDGALVLQHPDSDGPLIIEGADFTRLEGDIELVDLHAAQGSVTVDVSLGATVLGGDAFLGVALQGNTTVVLGSGEADIEYGSGGLPNEIITGEGRVFVSIKPGGPITAPEGQSINSEIELRVAEGDPAAGPTIIDGFDVAQTQLILFEWVDQSGLDTRASISLVDSDAGLEVYAGERLVAVLPGIIQADDPLITSTIER